MLDIRDAFGEFIILYGARTPADRIYKEQLGIWAGRKDIKVLQSVDQADNGWSENVGVVTTLFEKVKIDTRKTVAFVCGPPIMIRFAIQDLLGMGFADNRIISTLERYMKCGVGKCGHCAIGHKYICVDGPVFSFRQMRVLPEK